MSINEFVLSTLDDLKRFGCFVDSRNGFTKEIVGFSTHFSMEEVLKYDKRNVLNVRKGINYAFQIVERYTFLQGISRPDVLCSYVKNLGNYRNNFYNRFDGDYAPRIGKHLKEAYYELKNNPNSRRAIVSIRKNEDNVSDTLDHPCTLSFQFLIRDKKLHMIVNMRSNDAYISFAGYDTMNFTFIQTVMASWLGIPCGEYFLNAGSFHLYEKFFDADLVTSTPHQCYNNCFNLSFDETDQYLDEFFYYENLIRNSKRFFIDEPSPLFDDLQILRNYWNSKQNK